MKLRNWSVAVAVAALAVIGITPAAQANGGGTQPGNDGVHKVWVCKYSGTPYVDEVLKPGKNPIAVDASATVGTYFKDGQSQSYVLDEVTDENTAQGERYTGDLTCPEGRSFDWNWEYPAPTCDALTVTYPVGLPAGQANDVNVRIKNLTTGAEKTLNFHNNDGTWSGTKVFTFSSHSQWPDWDYYAVVWTQVGGTNYHWQGQVTCGEPEKPVKPEDKVERTEWAVSDYVCESESVTLERTVTTTTYAWDEAAWDWKATVASSTETDSRAMTDDEKAAQCEQPPVDVCKNLDGVQTEVPQGYKSDGNGNCCKCTPPPVVDKCLNIDGDQGTVPTGYTRDEAGDCWTPQPEPRVETTEWAVSDFMCESEKMKETRTVTTTTFTWDTATGTWTESTSSETETRTRAMTEDEATELCPPPTPHKVFVCKYVKTPGGEGFEAAQTGQNPISVSTNAIPGWDDSKSLEDNPKWFADAHELSMVIGWDEEQGDGQNNEPSLDDCLMPPTVHVGDWSGEPQCGVDSYKEYATETTTSYILVAGELGYDWQPVVTYKTLARTVYVEAIPCEDASASITVNPGTCAAPGSVADVTTEHATLSGELSSEPGTHSATFVAHEGHAFEGGATELVVEYTLDEQLTEGCGEEPTPPSIDGTIVGAVCTADAPYLGYDIKLTDPDDQSTDDGTATITFVHPTDASKNWTTTVPIGKGKILWPGASLDKNGVANNWPGYKYVAAKDEWVAVGNANYGWTRADDTEVIITVNPSKSFTVSYPPATPVCNSEPPETIVSVLDAPPATPVTGVASYTG